MEIKLIEINPTLVPTPGSRRQGYLTRFSAGTVVAWAVVVPDQDREEELKAGMTLPVQTSYDHLENWEAGTDVTSVQPLEKPGDYRVHGRLWMVGETSAAIVEAGVFAFDVSTSELPKPRPADGAFVAFTVRGLSLWESVEED